MREEYRSDQPGFSAASEPPPADGAPRAEPRFDTTGVGEMVGAKADLTKRVVAAIIDGVAGVLVGLIPVIGGIIAAAYWLLRDGFEFEFMDRRSLGKKVMKLRPVRLDGAPMDLAASAKRNWMFALGGIVSLLLYIPILGWILMIPVALAGLALGLMELVLVITDPHGRRLGDKLAGTQVIEVPE